jgi:signal transduction histidine kinase/ligand-binding sensor domain-containing protein
MQSTQILDRTNAVWVFSERTLHRHAGGERPDEIVEKAAPGNSEAIALNPISDAILVDREGSLWMATQEGVHRFSYSPLMEVALPKQPAPWFTLAAADGGVVWVAGGDGVGKSTLFRITGGKVDLQRSIAGVSSFAYRAPDGAFWFGGEGGLWRMTGGRLAKVDLPPEVAAQARAMLTMTHDGSGGAWVSFAGLGLYRLKEGAWTKYAGPRDGRLVGGRRPCGVSAVLATFTDATGRVWLGCQKDLLTVLDADGERIYGSGDGLQVGNVTAIHGRGPATWIGGESGLQRFDKGRFQAIRTEGDETLRGISGIVETPNGDLWVNGLGGIVHIRKDEIRKALGDPAYRAAVSRFDRRAGLPGFPSQLRRLPTAIEGTDGRLWFTVSNGVVWLDPAVAYGGTAPPPASIQSIEVDDKVHEPGHLPDFPPGTSSVRIGYAAVSLLRPEAVRFRYRLRDADAWRDAAHATSVTYRDLPPGTYRFQVGASDANGAWSDAVATAQFTILPAYYQTHWFRALCVLLLLLLAWVGYLLRIGRLHRQFELTLDARVAERTRIARELHDTLLQSFHGLLLRFQTAAYLLPDRPGEARRGLEGAIAQAAEAITEGRNAVQGLRASTVERNDLAPAIRTLGDELAALAAGHPPPAFSVAVEGEPRGLHPIVRDEIYKIAAEALRNAFRHAQARRVEAEVRYDDQEFRLRVRDDGRGIDPGVLASQGREGHYGLRGMPERATGIGGKLAVWSEPGAGTEVELRLPARTVYAASGTRSWWSRLFGSRTPA